MPRPHFRTSLPTAKRGWTTADAVPWAFALALGAALHFGLLVALFSALLGFCCIDGMARRLERRMPAGRARALALGVGGLALATGVALVALGLASLLDAQDGLGPVLTQMTDAVGQLRALLPTWLGERLPTSAQATLEWTAELFTQHAERVQQWGKGLITTLFHFFIGMMVGAMVATRPVDDRPYGTAAQTAAAHHLKALTQAFSRVVLAQVNVSLVNTVLTGLFLALVLPMLGWTLPFVKTLIVLTFVVGLIPILGNLTSNTAIVLVALSVAPTAAGVCLVFLVAIHKAEYFLNAWIVGTRVDVRSYELLAAMLVFEALFGVPGLIAAPVLYAYLKAELKAQGWR